MKLFDHSLVGRLWIRPEIIFRENFGFARLAVIGFVKFSVIVFVDTEANDEFFVFSFGVWNDHAIVVG